MTSTTLTTLPAPASRHLRRTPAWLAAHAGAGALIAGALLTVPLQAGWRPVGPYGGTITVLAVDPSRPSTILAGTPADGLFRSDDRGVTWEPAAGAPLARVSQIVCAAQPRPRAVLARRHELRHRRLRRDQRPGGRSQRQFGRLCQRRGAVQVHRPRAALDLARRGLRGPEGVGLPGGRFDLHSALLHHLRRYLPQPRRRRHLRAPRSRRNEPRRARARAEQPGRDLRRRGPRAVPKHGPGGPLAGDRRGPAEPGRDRRRRASRSSGDPLRRRAGFLFRQRRRAVRERRWGGALDGLGHGSTGRRRDLHSDRPGSPIPGLRRPAEERRLQQRRRRSPLVVGERRPAHPRRADRGARPRAARHPLRRTCELRSLQVDGRRRLLADRQRPRSWTLGRLHDRPRPAEHRHRLHQHSRPPRAQRRRRPELDAHRHGQLDGVRGGHVRAWW